MVSAQGIRKQPLLKLFIRLMLPVVTLAGFGGYASLFLIGFSDQKVISTAWSPAGDYRAEVIAIFDSHLCSSQTSYVVVVERAWMHIKTGELTAFCFCGSTERLDDGLEHTAAADPALQRV